MKKKNLLRCALGATVLAVAGLGVMAFANPQVNTTQDKIVVAEEEVKKEVVAEKLIHDFGTIKEDGETVTATFTIYNGTEEAVLLTKVTASCGCTTPSWTKEPIEPGKRGEVKATYNPKGRPGPFDKVITVTTNTEKRLQMHIKGTVE